MDKGILYYYFFVSLHFYSANIDKVGITPKFLCEKMCHNAKNAYNFA